MIDNDKFDFMLGDLLDELPEEFFWELQGGIIVSDEAPLSKYAVNDDLYVFGQYKVDKLGKQIIIYKGSFDLFYDRMDDSSLNEFLREVLRHEFRHHLEYLSGTAYSESLEADDDREIMEYLQRTLKQ